MNRGASKSDFLSVSLALACLISILAASTHGQPLLLKTETFYTDPGWDGRNNRATDPAPRQIVQNFGFNSSSTNAGGSAGEIGGFITPAGEPAFYGKVIAPTSFNDPLSASGILNVPQGGGHILQRRHRERVAHAQHHCPANLQPRHLLTFRLAEKGTPNAEIGRAHV